VPDGMLMIEMRHRYQGHIRPVRFRVHLRYFRRFGRRWCRRWAPLDA
jgi:hypothetical protein